VGLDLEKFATSMAKADDEDVALVYKKAGAKVFDMDDAIISKWKKIAEESAWIDYAKRSSECERFLKLAKVV
jgi:hypothetical protein